MKVFDIPLHDPCGGPYKACYDNKDSMDGRPAYMTVYAPMNWKEDGSLAIQKKRPAVVLFPGGGYHLTYEGEGEPVALKLVAAGAVVVVVRYSVINYEHQIPEPMLKQVLPEALEAVRYTREHAAEFGIDPDNISVMGFSAGGHVAAMAGTLWNKPIAAPYEDGDPKLYRPNKMILCYSVLKGWGEGTHHESIRFLLGSDYCEENAKKVSPVLQVDDETPEAFLWHCEDDGCVPVINTRQMAEALRAHSIHAEAHYYPTGGHGHSLGSYLIDSDYAIGEAAYFAGWIDDAIRFMLK